MTYEMQKKYSGTAGIKKAKARMEALRIERRNLEYVILNDSHNAQAVTEPQDSFTAFLIKTHQEQTAKANRRLKRIEREIADLLQIWPAEVYEPRWERGSLS